MAPKASRPPVDLGWFRHHVLTDILPHWLASAVTDEGLFLPDLDRQWRRLPVFHGTLVSQSRLLYNFAVGYELTGDEAYLRALRGGARFLLDKFRDHDLGGWFFSCGPGGTVVDTTKDSYGHAFVIFGLSHACRVTGDGEYLKAALEAWDVVAHRLTDRHGGLLLRADREFTSGRVPGGPGHTASQNPVMHLFEALLALGDLPGAEHIRDDARRVADFVLTRLVRRQDGALPEYFTHDWGDLPFSHGGKINVGHQFEWAYLLSSAVERGFPQDYLPAATALLEAGLRSGYDPEAGGVLTWATPDGQPLLSAKGWWEQCEATRALMHFAVLRNRPDFWEPCQKTIRFFQSELVDPEYGGWYADDSGNKGNAWKVDYHVVGMCVEAMRLEALL